MTKTCVKCGSSEFNKRNECLPCKREYSKKYDAENRESLILKKRERYERRKVELQAKAREYYNKNKSLRVEYGVKYRAEKPELVTVSQKSYRDKNRDQRNALRREYSKKFPERLLNYNRKRMNGIGCDKLSDGLTAILMSEQGGKCAGCCADLNHNIAQLDHFTPIKIGGRNIDSNIQLLCKQCNQSKSAKQPMRWLNEILKTTDFI